MVPREPGENPAWGYRRIAGALAAVQTAVNHQTVKNVFEMHGIAPAETS